MNVMALIVKFITGMIAFALGLDLFFNASWTDILSFALTLTVISYFVGDRILLPRIGSMNALVIDFFLTYGVVWLFGSVLFHSYRQIGWGSLISALIVTAGEVFVHRMLRSTNDAGSPERKPAPGKLAYGMEMADENEPIPIKKNND